MMTWIQTHTGKALDLLYPQPEQIDLRDIAHALSMQCRFNGHTPKHYSVAEHSVLVSSTVPLGLSAAGLFHDAAEAYIGDMVSPLKRAISIIGDVNPVDDIEAKIYGVIAQRFGIDVQDFASPHVKEADIRVLILERDAFFRDPPRPWSLPDLPAADEVIRAYSPAEAYEFFMARARELGITQ